jgi:RecA/RadA recombinase
VSRLLSTGCQSLDSLLGGGFERGTVTQVYGPPAAGKTNIMLSAALHTAATDSMAVYVDTEGISSDRFRQIADGVVDDSSSVDRDSLTSQVIMSDAHDLRHKQRQSVTLRSLPIALISLFSTVPLDSIDFNEHLGGHLKIILGQMEPHQRIQNALKLQMVVTRSAGLPAKLHIFFRLLGNTILQLSSQIKSSQTLTPTGFAHLADIPLSTGQEQF